MAGTCIATFHSTYQALKAEKLLKSRQIQADAVSAPRRFIADCGIALRFARADKSTVALYFQEQHIETAGIYDE